MDVPISTSISTSLTAGESFGDHFVIEEKIGAGGMGELYRLQHKMLKTHRALKVIRPQREVVPNDVERFLNEAKVLQNLRHPNIVQIHDFGVTADGCRIRSWST